jgi:hypothetical protein
VTVGAYAPTVIARPRSGRGDLGVEIASLRSR